jgi:hypothetical protein
MAASVMALGVENGGEAMSAAAGNISSRHASAKYQPMAKIIWQDGENMPSWLAKAKKAAASASHRRAAPAARSMASMASASVA